jgi:putative FmdB family regulatory protein
MPRYDYTCRPCQFDFEQDAAIDKRDTVGCPQCGRFADRKAAGPAFTLVGAGFHGNDYPRKGSPRSGLKQRKERE